VPTFEGPVEYAKLWMFRLPKMNILIPKDTTQVLSAVPEPSAPDAAPPDDTVPPVAEG
jgi:hypothetical protein